MSSGKLIVQPWWTSPVGLCVGIHLAADYSLLNHAWIIDGEHLWAAMAAVPTSQCSLAVVWAMTGRFHPIVRFAVPFVVVIACWYLLSRIMPWGLGEPASAGWAIALTAQTIVIAASIHLYPIFVALLGRRREEDQTGSNQPRLTFNIRTLILWTTVVALGFGFIQLARAHGYWTLSVAHWEYTPVMPLFGAYHAFVAVGWLWAIHTGSWRVRLGKTVVVVVLIGLFGLALSELLDRISGTPGIHTSETFTLAGAQSVALLVSFGLGMIRRAK